MRNKLYNSKTNLDAQSRKMEQLDWLLAYYDGPDIHSLEIDFLDLYRSEMQRRYGPWEVENGI